MSKVLEHNLIVVALLLVLVIISVLTLNYVFQSTLDRVEWQEDIYCVQRGDSLWGIAGQYCPNNVDRRDWIDEVRALNDLSSVTIYPGQELIVLTPAKEG